MDCPACKTPLMVLEYGRIEVDYCVACRGVWLDAGELELLYGDEAACEAFVMGGGRTGVKTRRRCPQCGVGMEERRTSGDAPVVYDRCRRGHGLWFDEGELASVLAHGHTGDREGRVAEFLRDLFPEAPRS